MKQAQLVRVRLGEFELDLRTGELRSGEATTLLREQPLQVLRLLVEADGELISREEIRKKLWPNDTIVEFDHSINAAIKNLRRALGDSADEPKYIETLARRGYRLMIPVERVTTTGESSSDESATGVAAALRLQPEPSLLGRRVSHYRVLEIIGGGGMGLVYKAEDLKLGRQVALKFLPEELATNPAALQRFEREAKTASSLNHPNICTIHEVDEQDDKTFIVMELLEGETLRDRLAHALHAQQTLPLDELLDIGLQIAAGLQAAHGKGIVHRDIKPANIFLTDSGQVKILDFGIAKAAVPEPATQAEQAFRPASGDPLPLSSRAERVAAAASEVEGPDVPAQDSNGEALPDQFPDGKTESLSQSSSPDATLTRLGVALGTVGYMSPEQVRGEKLDARSDLFSFGLILYEMTTGRRAFSGDTQAVLQESILTAAPIPAHDLNSTVPAKLEKIIGKALEKDREQRYQSAAEMKTDLQELKQDSSGIRTVTTDAAEPSVPRGFSFSVRRHPVIYTLIACALVAVVALVLTGVIPTPLHPKPQERHLAVLPFLNIGADPTDAAFAQGISETLTNRLSQLERFQKSFWVVPSADARTVSSLDQAHRDLDVTLAITGSVERTPDGVNITADLVNAADHRQLASRSVHVDSSNLNDLQQSVWEAVADMLDLQVPAEVTKELAEGGTSHPDAYRLYEEGNGYLHGNKSDPDRAIDLFSKAIAIDPNYALAYAGLGEAYGGKYLMTNDADFAAKATLNAARAVQLNDKLIPARMSLAQVYRRTGHQDKAFAEYKRVLEQDPTVIEAELNEAWIYKNRGNLRQAEDLLKHVIAGHPTYAPAYGELGTFYYATGRFNEAVEQLRTVIDLAPDEPTAYYNLGAAYIALGQYENAIAVLKKGLAIKPRAAEWSNLGAAYMYLGKWEEAADAMKRATELSPRNNVLWRNLGDAYDQIPSRRADALQAYQKALQLATEQLNLDPKDPTTLSYVALYHAHLSQPKEAQADIQQALEVAPKDSDVLFTAAIVYELTGRRDQSLKAVADAVKAGYSVDEIDKEPELRALHTDPRYKAWLGQIRSHPSSSNN